MEPANLPQQELKTWRQKNKNVGIYLKSVELATSHIVIHGSAKYVHFVINNICIMEKSSNWNLRHKG